MARDSRLGLGDKLALAATEKGKAKDAGVDPDLRHLPKGETVAWLLKSRMANRHHCYAWATAKGRALQAHI